jgi:hypothetical protein
VLDSQRARWRLASQPAGAVGVRRTVDTLEEIAIGRHLLELPSGVGANALEAGVHIEFGVVEDGVVRQLDRHGAQLRVSERVSLTVRNTSSDDLFVWVFDVGVSGRPALLTNAGPSGMLLGPAGSADARLSVWSPDGTPLLWPGDVPSDVTREETFVIVLADRRGDLSSLATPSTARSADATGTDVAALLEHDGLATRDVAPAGEAERPLRYRIEEISFFLTATSP